jgi:hypothetical protein
MAVWSDILWPIEIYIGFMDPCVDFMAWITVWKERMKKTKHAESNISIKKYTNTWN